MSMKRGDWLVRHPDFIGGTWEARCIEKGISPTAPIQVDDIVYDMPIFFKINQGGWYPEYFLPATFVEKNLTDYL